MEVKPCSCSPVDRESEKIYKSFYRHLQTLDDTKAASGLTWPDSQPTPTSAVLPYWNKWGDTPQVVPSTWLVKQMVHLGGGLFPLCLWLPFSTSPPCTTLNKSSDHQAANVPPATTLTSPDLCHLTTPARSLTKHYTLHSPVQNNNPTSKRQSSVYMCTA